MYLCKNCGGLRRNLQLNFQVREGDGLLWVPKKQLKFLVLSWFHVPVLNSKLGSSFPSSFNTQVSAYKTLFHMGSKVGLTRPYIWIWPATSPPLGSGDLAPINMFRWGALLCWQQNLWQATELVMKLGWLSQGIG